MPAHSLNAVADALDEALGSEHGKPVDLNRAWLKVERALGVLNVAERAFWDGCRAEDSSDLGDLLAGAAALLRDVHREMGEPANGLYRPERPVRAGGGGRDA